jgi:hypothetical protein
MERHRRKKEMAGHISAAVQHKRRMDAASFPQECNGKSQNPLKNIGLGFNTCSTIPESRVQI